MANLLSNKGPPDFTAEWIAKPGQYSTQRFERLLSLHNTKQTNKLKYMTIPTDLPLPTLHTVYAIKLGKWQKVGYRCADCGKPINDPLVISNHTLLCKNDKEINKRLEQEILERVGKPFLLLDDEEEEEE